MLLLRRAERSGRPRESSEPVLTSESVRGAELRARAERALAEERFADAVLDGYRALVLGQVEHGRLDDRPGATAHEAAAALATTYPEQRGQVRTGADLFDAVRYGERAPSREQAVAVLAIDATLRSRR